MSSISPTRIRFSHRVMAPSRVSATESARGSDGFSIEEVRKNGMVVLGNHVVIDHGNGEFSHLGHLKPGT